METDASVTVLLGAEMGAELFHFLFFWSNESAEISPNKWQKSEIKGAQNMIKWRRLNYFSRSIDKTGKPLVWQLYSHPIEFLIFDIRESRY